jgi:hypothetical protein
VLIGIISVAHFSFDIKCVISTRWLANPNWGLSHSPHTYFLELIRISYSSSKWWFSCLLNGHIGPPSMLAIEPRMVIIFEDVVQSLLNTCLFSFVLGATPNHIPLRYRFPIKMNNLIRHVYIPWHPLGELYFCGHHTTR